MCLLSVVSGCYQLLWGPAIVRVALSSRQSGSSNASVPHPLLVRVANCDAGDLRCLTLGVGVCYVCIYRLLLIFLCLFYHQ